MPEELAAQAEVTTTETVDTDTPVTETSKDESAPVEESTSTEEGKPKVEPETDAASDPAPTKPKKDKSEKKIAELAYQNREQGRRLDKALSMLEKQQESKTESEPDIKDFDDISSFLNARDKHNLKQAEASADAEVESQRPDDEYTHRTQESITELFEAGAERYEDFEEQVSSGDRISPVMRDAVFQIEDMDTQADVTYFLGKNRKEANRIFKLDPMKQVFEIGKLAVKVKKSVKQASKAPAPISPVGGSKTKSDEIQPVEDFESFMKKRNKQLGRGKTSS